MLGILSWCEWNQFTSSQFSRGSAAYETCFSNLTDFSLFLLFQSKAAYVLFYERQEPAEGESMEEKEIEQNPDEDVDMAHDEQ